MYGRVDLLALLDPSRQDIPDYAEYLGAIQRTPARVNDRFQPDGWMPIDLHIERRLRAGRGCVQALRRAARERDLRRPQPLAKEAPLVNERDGVLILSENAGAHEELGDWAITVNPFDVAGQAEAIHEALEMPADERRERARGDPVVGARARPHSVDRVAAAGSRRWTNYSLAV